MRIKEWEIEIEDVLEEIKKKGYKKILIQLPDGLKPYADKICDFVEGQGFECYIFFGSNFGACDIPLWVKDLGIEVIINLGHAKWISLELMRQEEER